MARRSKIRSTLDIQEGEYDHYDSISPFGSIPRMEDVISTEMGPVVGVREKDNWDNYWD